MENLNLATAAARDAGGRFLPGRSGNPLGKKPGRRNRATEIRAMLAEGEDMAVARTVIDKATSGDAVAARFVLGLLCPRPRPRGRAIALALPDGARAGDTVAAFNATLQAMAAGEITPDEAVTVTRMLDGRLEALNAFKLERELTRYRGEFIRGDELFRPAAERFREPGEVVAVAEEEDEGTEDEGEGDEEVVETDAGSRIEAEPSPACGRGQGEGSRDTDDGYDSDASVSPHPNPLPQALGEASLRLTRQREPSVPARAGEGMMGTAADNSPGNRMHPGASPPDASPDEDLHSACIEQDLQAASLALQAESAARQAAQRKLAQWGYLIRTQPGFSEESFIAAEVQRSAALKRSSASLPGHNSRSPSALNGVATVLR
jgi:hypothetical protein